jgi:hypothetical protein
MNVATLSASKGVSVMKACRIHNFGSPEVIALEDMEKPEPGTARFSSESRRPALDHGMPGYALARAPCRNPCR